MSEIKASDDLLQFLAEVKENGGTAYRLVKISISDGKFVISNSEKPSGTEKDEYDRLVLPQLEDKYPCYILYRLDSKSLIGYDWIFIFWTPNGSPLREKMLYAVTIPTFKTEFDSRLIRAQLTATDLDGVCWSEVQAKLA